MSVANGSNWQGVATATATITVTVGPDYSEAGTVTVKARENWSFPSLSARAEESSSISTLGAHEVSRVPTTVPAPTAGSGPWQGQEMASTLPPVINAIKIHADLWGKGSRHYGASSTCDASSSLRLRERVGTVNETCGTSAGLTAFFNETYAHEEEHESGYNSCLASAEALRTITKIEGTVGATGTVQAAIQGFWNDFYNDSLRGSGARASGGVLGSNIWLFTWYLSSQKWQYGAPRWRQEGGRSGC